MRRLRLPKLGPPKTSSFFEEYFYACVGVLFLVMSMVCWAGGMHGFDALVLGAWIAGAVWSGKLLRGYFREKEKTKEAARPVVGPAKAPEAGNGKKMLPLGMKPMIGIQWPIKSGVWPTRPGLKTAPSIPVVPLQGEPPPAEAKPPAPPPGSPASTRPVPAVPGKENQPGFRYERPTLPDRKPKLPHNWREQKDKKPKR